MQASGTIFEDTSADDYAYWRALKKHWDSGDDLMLIEQDIGLRGGEVASFMACSENWCTYSYPYPGMPESFRLYCWLGCTRYSAKLQAAIKMGATPVKWNELDQLVLRGIRATGFIREMPHGHGDVLHYHEHSPVLEILDPLTAPTECKQVWPEDSDGRSGHCSKHGNIGSDTSHFLGTND